MRIRNKLLILTKLELNMLKAALLKAGAKAKTVDVLEYEPSDKLVIIAAYFGQQASYFLVMEKLPC